ncbi:hypothetical protein PoB_006092700 [Plakobranchus ocellatus]|uniref:Uncharacterized protein n=1 Tax=Plakobranchus ocellatus TaxID=259542 RepID=A0AAV4CRB6_9GAST|nr:hypothetical protein PoB_006092700 [Plakobranchus ocellatus]
MAFQRDCTFLRWQHSNPRAPDRERNTPLCHAAPIPESTFGPGSHGGRFQAQSILRTQSQFDESIVLPIPPQNGDL